jgi:hypothetical protein
MLACRFRQGKATVPGPKGDAIHHAGFGFLLKEKWDALGLECTLEV